MYFIIEGVHDISLVDVKSVKDEAKLGRGSINWVLIVEVAGVKESTWDYSIS